MQRKRHVRPPIPLFSTVLALLCLCASYASALSPAGSPVADAHSVNIVVTTDASEDRGVLPLERDIAEFIRAHIRNALDQPPSGPERPRPDLPVRIVNAPEYYEAFRSNFDLVVIWNFNVRTITIQDSTLNLVSYSLFYGFFGSDRGILVGNLADGADVGAWFTNPGASDFFMRLQQLIGAALGDEIAYMRTDRYRDIGDMGFDPRGARQRVFSPIAEIKVFKSYLGDSTNPLPFRTIPRDDLVDWTKEILEASLTGDGSERSQPRLDIVVTLEGDLTERSRRLLLYLKARDLGAQCGTPYCAVQTFVVAFMGPGYEILLTSPRSFVAATRAEYKDQFQVHVADLLKPIVEQLRDEEE